MMQSGLVVPSVSPFASPVLLVKKKNDSWRFCVDYKKLNASTFKNKFPMPIIDEFLDEIAGATYFNKLDLNSGFIRSGWYQVMNSKQPLKPTMDITNSGLCLLA
jgi:hypothetical protein